MASIGEIMACEIRAEATPVMAEVVTHESMVLYDLESDLNCLTVEELYVRLEKELDEISIKEHKVQPKKASNIIVYLCELFRRNITLHEAIGQEHYVTRIYNIGKYRITNRAQYDESGWKTEWGILQTLKASVKVSLPLIQTVREIQVLKNKEISRIPLGLGLSLKDETSNGWNKIE
jgi:hypothetical protein